MIAPSTKQLTQSMLRSSSVRAAPLCLRLKSSLALNLQDGNHPQEYEVVLSSTQWSNTLSFASPESDFSAALSSQQRAPATAITVPQAERYPLWSHSLSFASPESDFTGDAAAPPSKAALPRTLKDALLHYEDRALVITTAQAPHSIVYVNKTWEDLCGYTKESVLHKPIGPLLQGQETNTSLARAMVAAVLDNVTSPSTDAYLVNYKASGESFVNHVTAGPLYLDDEQDESSSHAAPQFLVGILEEVAREQVPLRMAV